MLLKPDNYNNYTSFCLMVRLVSADYRFQEFQTAAAVFGVV